MACGNLPPNIAARCPRFFCEHVDQESHHHSSTQWLREGDRGRSFDWDSFGLQRHDQETIAIAIRDQLLTVALNSAVITSSSFKESEETPHPGEFKWLSSGQDPVTEVRSAGDKDARLIDIISPVEVK